MIRKSIFKSEFNLIRFTFNSMWHEVINRHAVVCIEAKSLIRTRAINEIKVAFTCCNEKKTYDGATWKKATATQSKRIEIGFQSKTFFCVVDVLVCVLVCFSRIECSGVQRLQAPEWNLSMVLATTFTKSQALSSPASDNDDFSTLNGFFLLLVFTSIHCSLCSEPRLHACLCVCVCRFVLRKENLTVKTGVFVCFCCCVNSSPCYNKNRDVYGFSDS